VSKWKFLASILAGLGLLVGILFMTPLIGGAVPADPLPDGDFILYAGQTIDAGSGTVEFDGDSLNFSIDPNCAIGCIKVGVWDDDNNLPSNPSPGSDLTLGEYNCPAVTPNLINPFGFEIAFTLPGDWDWPIVIALHADTLCGVYTETAWACAYEEPGNCPDFPGPQWAYYFWYGEVD
jgi:hypothetical protein